MQRRNLDFGIPLTREQWDQLGRSANFRPDFGVLRWSPDDPETIEVSIRADDRPDGWENMTPPLDDMPPNDRQVARFRYNDGRPFAQLEPAAQPSRPAVSADVEDALDLALERWVRGKWHELLRLSGLHYDRGSLPATEPRPPR